MRKIGFVVILCLSSLFVFSQNDVKLTSGWEFFRSDIGGSWEAFRPSKKDSPESIPVWEKVNLPHCYNATDAVEPYGKYYQGPAWYRNLLEINNPYVGGRTLLHFQGAGQKTQVYVFSKLVGTHVGGYDEFSIDITDAVKEFQGNKSFKNLYGSKIPIAIRCDNSRDLELIPSNLSDFTLYGGIYRNLTLKYIPSVALEHVLVKPVLSENMKEGSIVFSAQMYKDLVGSKADVTVRVIDANNKVAYNQVHTLSLTSDEFQVFNVKIKNPILWSTDNPKLYTYELVLKTDAGEQKLSGKIGFRTFEFVKKGFFKLNGTRLLLRGTHRHEDHAGLGQAMTEELIRKEMMMIKDMGANFIRLGHYQQSRQVLELCDSLGILVWEEIPWCRGGLGGDVYKEQARRMLRNMITQHYNHPSIILWGLGNENDWPGDFQEFDKEKIRGFMSELNQLSHTLDPDRKTCIRRCEFCKDIVDVYSPSIWAGWYRGKYTEYKANTEKEIAAVDRFFHAEWGGDSHARRHSENPDRVSELIQTGKGADERQGDFSFVGGDTRASKDGDWSETYICNLIDWHLKEQETMPQLTGSAYWTFKDFATPIRPENPVPFVNQKGVVERDLTPKESYYVFQSYWSKEPMAHIYGHTWPVRWGKEGETKILKVYSNCEQAELFLNNKSLGVKKRNSQDFPAAGFHWLVALSKGTNNVKVIAKQYKTVVTDEISFLYQTEEWGAPSKIVLEIIEEKADIVTVQAKLLDKNGVQCLDSRDYVEFSQIGDGSLIHNMGTSTASKKIQAYNGRAIISIKKNKGKSVICVKSSNIQPVFINVF